MKELIDLHSKIDSSYKEFIDYSRKDLEDYIEETINSKNKIILVADENKNLIGYLMGEIIEAPYYSKEKKIGVITDTAVGKKYRQHGILTAMFKESEGWFSRKKVNFIELSVDARNSDAIFAWKKLGFKDYKLRLRKLL